MSPDAKFAKVIDCEAPVLSIHHALVVADLSGTATTYAVEEAKHLASVPPFCDTAPSIAACTLESLNTCVAGVAAAIAPHAAEYA